MKREEAELPTAECKWHLLVLVDGQVPDLQSYGHVGELRHALMQQFPGDALLVDEVRVYIFFGIRAVTTRPPNPNLLHPAGVVVPLYDPNATLKMVTSGVLNARSEVKAPVADAEDADSLFAAPSREDGTRLSGPGSPDAARIDMVVGVASGEDESADDDDSEPVPDMAVVDEEPG